MKLVSPSVASYNRGMLRAAVVMGLVARAAFAQALPGPPVEPVPTELTDLMQARNFGMAGAYRSLGYGAEAVGGNPAAISLYKRYQIEVGGAYDFTRKYGFGSVAVCDSQTSPVAAGSSYHLVTYDGPGGRSTAHVTTAAVAYPLASFLHLGLSSRYHLIYGPNPTNSITMAAGVIVQPFDWLTLSVSGHNLIPVYNVYIQRYFSFAVSSMLGGFTPTFELKGDFNTTTPRFSYSGGIEYVAANEFPLRIGYTWDGIAQRQYLGAGLGYVAEGSGIDLSYRHDFSAGSGNMFSLTVKIQMN